MQVSSHSFAVAILDSIFCPHLNNRLQEMTKSGDLVSVQANGFIRVWQTDRVALEVRFTLLLVRLRFCF